jgi:excisionase family DNA binding protein
MNASESSSAEPSNERIAYSIHEAADMLGVDYFSVYRLIQRGKLKACRALRGKFLIPRTELFRLLNAE